MADGKGLAWREVKKNQQLLLLQAPGAEESLKQALRYAGSSYDYKDIIGMIFRKNWCTPGRYICDMAIFQFQETTGNPLLNHRFIPMMHLTPRDVLLSPFVREWKES